MEINKTSRRYFFLNESIFTILFLVIVGLVATLSVRYSIEFDWTSTGRHKLSEPSKKILEQMAGKISISCFLRAGEKHPAYKRSAEFLNRYKAYKSDINIKFIDSYIENKMAAELNIQDGGLLVEYQNRNDVIYAIDNAMILNGATLSHESILTNGLQRLLRNSNKYILFVTDHGERDPAGAANHDYGLFMQQISPKGFNSRKISLAHDKIDLASTATLVIASPQIDYYPSEIKTIIEYLKSGGNLLWLADPSDKPVLSSLADYLGISFMKGVVVHPESAALLENGHPAFVVLTPKEYQSHEITRDFTLRILLPQIVAINKSKNSSWSFSPFLKSPTGSWVETGNTVKFDAKFDILGPVDIGLVATRNIENTTSQNKTLPPYAQRVVIVGNGAFISNQFSLAAGNSVFGEKIINWIAHDDSFIDIPTITAPDKIVELTLIWAILNLFLLYVLPFFIAGTGLVIWLRRRKR
jgi:hypothetical protein